MEIHEFLVKLRQQKGLKQKEAAALIGIPGSVLSQIETGARELSTKNLEKISKAYDIPKAVILFISLDEKDVPEENRELFKHFQPAINNILKSLYNVKSL